jgi:hypothetical protein
MNKPDWKEYFRNGCCPYCGSENLEGEGVNIDGDTAEQEVGCNDCNRSWYDKYSLIGVWVPSIEPGEINEFIEREV